MKAVFFYRAEYNLRLLSRCIIFHPGNREHGKFILQKEMQAYYDRFSKSFVENRDPCMDLEISVLKQLAG